MPKSEARIADVEAEIAKVEAKAAKLDEQIEVAKARSEAEEVKALRAEKKDLSRKEIQLRKKEKHLRTKVMELRADAGKKTAGGPGAVLASASACVHASHASRCLLFAAAQLVSKPPHLFGKPEVWQKEQFAHQRGVPPFLSFCPPHAFPESIPACLASPAFGRFIDACQAAEEPSGMLDMADYAAVQRLCVAMCEREYALEEDRGRVLLELMKHFGLSSDVTTVPGSSSRFDGVQCVSLIGERVVVALAEWKNGIAASSTDPEYQLMCDFYSIVWAGKMRKLRAAVEGPYAVLGVEAVGRMIRFSAMACCDGERILWEPLTPFLNMLPMVQAQPRQMRALAAALCAFRNGVHDLIEEQRAREACVAVPGAAALPYPLRNAAQFTDVAPMDFARTPLYRARHATANGSTRVLVKFVHGTYGEVVHASWAAAGLAPALHSVTLLPGGMKQVVMEELPAAEWTCAALMSATDLSACSGNSRVRAALARAHALPLGTGANAPRGAHGDCRPGNVLLRAKWSASDADEGVRFIDFDWAGAEGVTHYPAFMHELLPWPHGAAPGKTLQQAHDVQFWESTTLPV